MNRTLRLLFVCLLQAVWAVASAYNLKVEATPQGACSLNTSGGEYDEGSRVYLRTYGHTGYVFRGWYKGDEVISSSASFYYTMPAEDVVLQARYEYDPSVPADPAMPDTTRKYALNVGVSPHGAGSLNTAGGKYAEGTRVSLRAYVNTGFHFTGWTDESGETLSTSTNFTYVMPGRDVQLMAKYYYDPSVPADPDSMATQYTVKVKCKPVGGGTFNTSSTTAAEGSAVRLHAYTNTGYYFRHWEDSEGQVLSTDQNFYYTIPHGNSVIYGVFEYDPPVPSNPAKNYWNKELGEVIVDDFSAGGLGNAVSTVINGSSRDEVAMITVAGKMNDNDFGIANNYTNCKLFDLSRVTGITMVPSYAFDYTNLEAVSLPASIETIGYRAFYECKQLSSLTLYSMVPPSVENAVFDGVPEGLVIYVPEGSIELYEDADAWKNFIIMPIRSNVHSLELSLPDECRDGRYKNMALELVNVKSGQKYKYVVTDRLNYIFSNLIKNTTYNAYLKNLSGIVLAEIDSIEIDDKDVSLTFSDIKLLKTVRLSVLAPDGTDVTSQLAIRWMDNNGQMLAQGDVLTGQVEGSTVRYSLSLPQNLAMQYVWPEDGSHLVKEDDNAVICQLDALPQLTLKGKVVEARTQMPIAQAVVTAAQTLNGKYAKAVVAKTDAQGEFSMTAFAVPTRLTWAEQEHITHSMELADSLLAQSEVDLGTIALKAIAGFTITTEFTYTPSVESGTPSFIIRGYSDHQNVTYGIYNKTQGKAVTKFSVQYPKIVLLEEVGEGDVLQVTAMSKNNAFKDVSVEVVVNADNQADATFNIVQWGAVKSVFSQTDNLSVVSMLYDAAGVLVKKYSYESATLVISDLPDGDYTLVTMGESDFFNSISTLRSITDVGLTEGVDFIRNVVTVKSGRISVVKNAVVPFFDESKLYYTGENTSFTVNKPSIVMGNYLTFTAKVDFKEAYVSQVSNLSLVIDLPESVSFVNASLMVGSRMGDYVFEDHRLTVPVNSLADLERIRFCAIPAQAGEFAPTAYVTFTLAGKTVQQPIGSATFTSKGLSVSVPPTIADTTFAVSGTATGLAKVEVYDGLELIGSTTASASGLWSVRCELVDASPFTKHDIYARITTKDGVEMLTETQTVTYNPYHIEVDKVLMINTAHGGGSLALKQYVTKFDFQNPSLEKKVYWYWPNYPDFTFKAYLTSNDTAIIDRVFINVFTEDGRVRSLRASYSRKDECWIATDKFHNGHLPINVSVNIDDCQYNLTDSTLYEAMVNDLLCEMDFRVEKQTEDSIVTNVFDRNGEFIQQVAVVKEQRTYKETVSSWNEAGYAVEMETDSVTLMTDSISGNYVFVMKDETREDSVWTVLVSHLVEHWHYTRLEDIKTLLVQGWETKVGEKIDCAEGTMTEIFQGCLQRIRKYTFLSTSFSAFKVYLLHIASPDTILRRDLIGRITFTIRRRFSRIVSEFTSDMYEIVSAYNCSPPPTPLMPVDGDATYVQDPSGFVYEGVESNRLQGVTATCYYKETVEDMYGDLHENVVLWNAEDYAQENPLFTDENGMYQWDVPQGLWQVKFEKEGYQTAYSEWLPVPPPQLEVNIGMVQNAQPEVVTARAYEDGAEIEFSKYMQTGTLTSDNLYLKVKIGDVEELLKDVTVECPDAEAVSKTDATQYAKKAVLKTERDLGQADEVYVIVSNKVKSYAGITMAETFTQQLDVEKKVRKIVAEATYNVGYEQAQTITVGAQPNDASKGKTMRVKAVSDLIASIEADGAALDDEGYTLLTLDENGQASLKVNGDLFGTTALVFKMQDSDVSAQSVVNVVDPAKLVDVKDVMASRISGTSVYRGQTVTFSCETEGATIYYTLDGSCPCDEATRLKYDGKPIAINDSTTIKALAVGINGSVSQVKEFSYTIKQTSMQIALAEGWNWTSHNQAGDLEASRLQTDDISRVVSFNAEMVKDPALGFVGDIETVKAEEAVKIQAAKVTNLTLTGELFNPNAHAISLVEGWNWLGYPMDQIMEVGEALSHLEAEEGDRISAQEGFAEYSDGAWTGTLNVMVPGKGYLYKSLSGNSFLYNDAIVSKAKSIYARRLQAQANPWTADPHAYPNMMCITADLFEDDCKAESDKYCIAAFCGEECRGVGQYVKGIIFLSVYGDKSVPLTFLAAECATGEVYTVRESVEFNADVLGSVKAPFAFHLGEPTGVEAPWAEGQAQGVTNLLGQKVNRTDVPGIYIINGKKVLIRNNKIK